MIKCHFVIDKTHKNKKLKNTFLSKYKNHLPQLSNVIVVLGGDGFMLQTLKKYQKFNKSFYGINSGTFGFLMNKFKTYDIEKSISKSKLVFYFPFRNESCNKKQAKTHSNIAINEVSLLRQTRQTASLQIANGKRILIKKLICDGVSGFNTSR